MAINVEIPGHRKTRIVRFSGVTVIPQAAGALYSLILDERGRVQPEGSRVLEESLYVTVIDIGYRTTDYLLVDTQTLEVVESVSGTIDVGTSDIYRAIQRELQEMAGTPVDIYIVEKAARQDTLRIKLKDYPIGLICERAVDTLVESIIDKLDRTWKQYAKHVSVAYVAGGGAPLVTNALARRGYPYAVVPDYQFANCRGFLGIAQRRLSSAATLY